MGYLQSLVPTSEYVRLNRFRIARRHAFSDSDYTSGHTGASSRCSWLIGVSDNSIPLDCVVTFHASPR